jgi:hypothetical protein
MPRPAWKLTSLLLLCVVIAAACSSNVVKSLTAMNALRQRLIQKYGDEVTINLHNSRFLQVTFVNSPLNNADSARRFARAADAARFVAVNYEPIRTIDQIWIGFVAVETRLVVIHYTRGIESFGFRNSGAPLGDETPATEDARAPIARFSDTRNETDISVTRIQLEGDMKRGIALVPHFAVTGDARRSGSEVPPPEFVVVDFASYSDRPLFSANTNLEIYCDDRLAIKGSARLLSKEQSGTEDTIAQFLTARITYKGFYRMANAQKLAIRLGNRRFDLLPEDIEALKGMTAYVAAPATVGR